MKFLKSLLLTGLVATFLTSCGNQPTPKPNPEHVHTFEEGWTSNETDHWHKANCGHDLSSGIESHIDLNSDGKCDKCGRDVPVILKEFEGLSFSNKTFTYDGKEHAIYVQGVPDFATVEYKNNNKIEPNTYPVEARVKAPGYKTKLLNAKLIIKGLTFEGITFVDQSISYDGKVHSLVAQGVPDFATVTYSNNGKTAIGSYDVTATIEAEHYQTLILKAKLTITGKQFTGITFEDQVFLYDSNYHSIYAQGVPNFADVVYENNDQKYEDTYIVKATITAEGYETLVLTAKMTITKKIFPDATFSDLCWIYDGKEVNLKAYFESYEEKLDDNRINYSVVYKVNGVASKTPTIKNVGTYNVSATYSASGFPTKTFSFNVAISDQIGVTDPNKTAFKITNDLKFKNFYAEIKKGNFSIKAEGYDEYDYDKDGIYEKVVQSNFIGSYFVSEEGYAGRRNENASTFEADDYYVSKGKDYAYKTIYEYGSLDTTKFPVDCYSETVIDMSHGMLPFALLKESNDGGFESNTTGGGVISCGFYEIDVANNCFILFDKTPYEHPEYNHNEVTKYYFYNIGNTKVNIPDAMKGKDNKASTYNYASFIKNGIKYYMYNDYFAADVRMTESRFAYVGGITNTLKAEIDGIKVNNVFWDDVRNPYNVEYENYVLCLYFNDDGVYQGKYSSLGSLTTYSLAIRRFDATDAMICYYGEW